ncbi:MAG: hypothetical protein FWG69_04300, partial [Oscillospiraceae bacterium]|nr:hypothetical protein [Oscillospiraceae bacterium]
GTILHSVSQAQLTLGGALTVDFTESPVTAFRFLFGKFAVIVSESAQDAVEFSAYGRANIVLFYDLSEENTEYKSLVRQNKYYIMDFTQQNDLKLSEIFDSTAYQRTVLLLHPNGNIRIFGENDFVL